MSDKSLQQAERLIVTAVEAASAAYSKAIAAQFEKNDKLAEKHWATFRRIVARSLLYSELTAMAAAFDRAAHAGADLDFTDQEVEREKFGKLSGAVLEMGDEDDFIVGEFREAVQAFEDRIPRLRERVSSSSARIKDFARRIIKYESKAGLQALIDRSPAMRAAVKNSFWVSDTDKRTTLNLRKLVADVIRGDSDGTRLTLPEFIDQAQLQGAANLTRARLETVLRNNTMQAYNDGMVAVMEAPEVTDTFPLLQLTEIQDRRTRGNPSGFYPDGGPHYQMNGYINTLAEFKRQGIVPPNGHRCRAGMREMTRAECERLGLLKADGSVSKSAIRQHNGKRQGYIDRGEYPDEGWNA